MQSYSLHLSFLFSFQANPHDVPFSTSITATFACQIVFNLFIGSVKGGVTAAGPSFVLHMGSHHREAERAYGNSPELYCTFWTCFFFFFFSNSVCYLLASLNLLNIILDLSSRKKEKERKKERNSNNTPTASENLTFEQFNLLFDQ